MIHEKVRTIFITQYMTETAALSALVSYMNEHEFNRVEALWFRSREPRVVLEVKLSRPVKEVIHMTEQA